MRTKINVEVMETLRPRTLINRALVILKYAEAINDEDTFILNNLEDLEASLKATTEEDDIKASEFELAQVEYLLNMGVSVVATIGTDNLEEIIEGNNENQVRVVTAPNFVTAEEIETIADTLKSAVDPIELHINIDTIGELSSIADEVGNNRNVSIFAGKGKTNMTSVFSSSGEILIPASVAVQARKVINLENETPWIPIAGETTGRFTEFTDVEERFSRSEITEFQTEKVNPMITKLGVGVHMVAQNTREKGTVVTNPLLRAHANTLTNYLILKLGLIGDRYFMKPNIQKTWDLLDLELRKVLRNISRQDGIEQFRVLTGLNVMTQEDIATGLLKAKVHFLPVRVIEAVELTLFISDDYNIDVQLIEESE